MNDTISRQAAIEALRGYLVGKRCPDDGTLTCRLIENEVINKLPPAQLSTNLAEVGTDCISRQALLDKFEPWLKVKDYNDGELNMLKAVLYEIRFMRPAQPERIKGHWIAMEKKNLFRCSKCDAVIYSESEYDRNEFHKFCGRCGADMREVTT